MSTAPSSAEAPRVVTVDEVDGEELHRFLSRFFTPVKAEFLRRHGAWWHRGEENRMVLAVGSEIAGYCAVIPGLCRVEGEAVPALWWMDLVIAPEHRGRRFQSLLDDEVRRRAGLLLGFPNELAAKIHRKHGWGVREDLAALLAPLVPSRLGAVRRARGFKGFLLRAAALALTPAAALWRRRLAREEPGGARLWKEPSAAALATVAALGSSQVVTLMRDEDHFRWRYLEGPHRSQLRFFAAGGEEPTEDPTAVLILRLLPGGESRVLDLFGDLGDAAALHHLLRRTLAEACREGAGQVTALAATPELRRAFKGAGFFLSSTARFCWSSTDGAIMEAIDRSEHHWCLGDSDHDEPR